MKWFKRRRSVQAEIAPEDIFLDSSNLPEWNASQFEGRVEKPVSHGALIAVGAFFAVVAVAFTARAFELQIQKGGTYAEIAKNNTLDHTVIFATRGVIKDRNGTELVWNMPPPAADATTTPFALRAYTKLSGLAHLLGFVRYPRADAAGNWWRENYAGVSGIELSLDGLLEGKNGEKIVSKDARGKVIEDNIISPPVNGEDVTLSIDADIQSKLHDVLSAHAQKNGFQGGAAVIMDVRTGEIIAITSFPEYDNAAFGAGNAEAMAAANNNTKRPMLNRAVAGLYAPGSIVKPIFAIAALNEGIISPDKRILSTGQLVLPNPYDASNPSIFRDWTVHGWVDMRTAIAVSSDEYFYVLGGGFKDQKGLGIEKIDEYARRFGLASKTGIALPGEAEGVIPTPAWKVKVFGENDPWRIGNTYHTAIGQFGFQITPLEAVRFTAAIANGGKLLKPQLFASSTPEYTLVGIADEYIQIAREGMRMAVTSTRSDATVKALNIGGIEIAAKTGTAQIGAHNEWMNSWSVGFWPVDNPRYAYAIVLERAPAHTASGAAPGARPFFDWLIANKPRYIR